MNICLVGTGYVGLVTGAVFAEIGHSVCGVDSDVGKIARLQRGEMPIYEPDLDTLVARNLAAGRLRFTTDLPAAVAAADIICLCVGTPPTASGEPDLRQIQTAAAAVGRAMSNYKIIVNKSTVPVGTAETVRHIVREHCPAAVEFDIVSNPEFLREGSAVADAFGADRIVVGAQRRQVAEIVADLYAPLCRPVQITDVASAEMIKYASNAFLATKISFANAVANICEGCGADIIDVIQGMGSDRRIGRAFLDAGLGYGGSCLPKDTSALVHLAERCGYDFALLKAVIATNELQIRRFLQRLHDALGGFAGKEVAVLGLAFKPNTDDIREARSLPILSSLLAGGANVRAYDPVAMGNAVAHFPQIHFTKSVYAAVEFADAAILATDWDEFRALDWGVIRKTMRRPLLFDGRNLCQPETMRRLGFEYYGVGRGTVAVSRPDAGVSPAVPSRRTGTLTRHSKRPPTPEWSERHDAHSVAPSAEKAR